MELQVEKREARQREEPGRTITERDVPPSRRVAEVGTVTRIHRHKRRAAWHPDNWNPVFVVIGFVLLFAVLTSVLLYFNPA